MEATDLQAQLWEIDENLARANLAPAEEAQHVQRRAEIIVELAKDNCAQIARKSAGRSPIKFHKDTASATGLSVDKVKRAQSRADKIAPEVLKEIPGTSLDKGVELDALAENRCRMPASSISFD